MIDEKKLIEEIKGWQEDIHDNEYDADKYDFVFERIYEILYEQPKVGEWIPIGQYPDEPSLLCFENGRMAVGYYDYDEWEILTDSEHEKTCFGEEPIAWQPLPKPYKSEE